MNLLVMLLLTAAVILIVIANPALTGIAIGAGMGIAYTLGTAENN